MDNIRRADGEVEHALDRLRITHAGLKQMNLAAHALMVENMVSALEWSMGRESTFDAFLSRIDSVISSAVAHTN